MANGVATDEEDVDAQDQVDQTAAPQITAPMGAPAVRPAVVAPPGVMSPAQIQSSDFWERMRHEVENQPLAQAEQAVSTALKFQAIRGYQKDLEAGTSAAEALTKWAPLMFSQPKAGTLGQAASLVRAGSPQEKYMDIGGVGYQMKGGQAIPLTPGKAKTVPLVVPADPQNPMSGGHVTIQLPLDDPLIEKSLKRAREGAPPEPPPPTFFESIFGRKTPPTAAAPAEPSAPATAVATPAPAISPMRLKSPQDKLTAARALRALHPEWTKKQILDAVNK